MLIYFERTFQGLNTAFSEKILLFTLELRNQCFLSLIAHIGIHDE